MTAPGRAIVLSTPEDTLRFGRRLGAMLLAGDLVLLAGPLGAGKTLLTKGIAAGMQVDGLVTSPTFVIARVHRATVSGRPSLVHVDAYRLAGALELDDLDLDTDLTASAVVVEWGEGRAEQLARDHLVVRLTRQDDDSRLAELIGTGPPWHQRIRKLAGAR